MEINISTIPKSTKRENIDDRPHVLQLLPCNIDHDGKANIDKYFIINKLKDKQKRDLINVTNDNNSDNNESNELYETFFRGRRLIGKIHEINKDCEGYIFKEANIDKEITQDEEMNEQTRDWNTIRKFDSFMVWEQNEIPSPSNNQILKSLEWLEISKVIHEPTPPTI
ncbi:3800_t:CDS:2 [Diversispora eburnea]|uniref:3800_t:CDS:1 n=1 Tax=Diversispora eburnea TaxID=1213867 RepID=A0A9N8VVD0_9GLOM|nr:3800_t:CDS:2 [Diversispora eburnea]